MTTEKAKTETKTPPEAPTPKPKMSEILFRKATVHDTGTIKELVQMFHKEFISGLGFDMSDLVFQKIAATNVLASTWVAHLPDEPIPAKYDTQRGERVLVAQPDIKFGKVVGVFSGYYTTYILNNEKLFHELVWYVHPEYRRCGTKLYEHCEKSVKEQGAKKIVMIHMATSLGDKLTSLYEKMGYKPLETHYVKDI